MAIYTSPIPKRLKQARTIKCLSQKRLGIMVGIDEFSASARMNHYEQGRHTPTPELLAKIATVLDVPDAFFYSSDDKLAALLLAIGSNNKEQAACELERIFTVDPADEN